MKNMVEADCKFAEVMVVGCKIELVEQIGTVGIVVVSSVAVEREMFAVESFESHVTG